MEDLKFKTSLGYIARPQLKKKQGTCGLPLFCVLAWALLVKTPGK
jgi:hypothetical protein